MRCSETDAQFFLFAFAYLENVFYFASSLCFHNKLLFKIFLFTFKPMTKNGQTKEKEHTTAA